MLIGIPKEILHHENRVAATPETVKKYREMGFEVLVEGDAGKGVYVSDEQYREAGARVLTDAVELFQQSDIILKVKQPCPNERYGKHEAEMIKEGGTLITFLHPAAPSNHSMIKTLRDRRILSFTMDSIPRTSRAQKMDALTSMSTITGYKSVLVAAGHLPQFIPMVGTAIGMTKPAKVLVIGAGVVGLQALATAKRLGGITTCVDIRPEAREEAKSLGAKVGEFEVPVELAKGEGGYAKALPKEWIEKERAFLAPIVADSDIIILSALVPGEVAPVLITEKMIAGMRPGSVIVDVSVDQGGNCEATKPGEEVRVHDVMVSGVQNIPGSVPVHASWLYANNMVQYLSNLYKQGPGQIDWNDDIVKATLVTKNGEIVHDGARKAMGLA
ncbi:MAG TPA: NAD(P) transhydrogenase subunit alpha [bacterium]|nr:NAD(P) transhydrogenase subunit alpha [Myxococcales bacterium]HPW44771.1 NAD(P) transhydrogenase subunit alpha [bacterium]HQH81120.1 NAD(P) transhydrogenase subunit alpha [bacterium]